MTMPSGDVVTRRFPTMAGGRITAPSVAVAATSSPVDRFTRNSESSLATTRWGPTIVTPARSGRPKSLVQSTSPSKASSATRNPAAVAA